MDRYEHWIGKLAKFLFSQDVSYAVTLGQTTYFSCYAYQVGERWHKHEDEHKKQWKKGRARFITSYIYQWLTKGYNEIDFEVEARAAELK